MTPTCQAWHKDRCLVWNHQIDQERSIQQPTEQLVFWAQKIKNEQMKKTENQVFWCCELGRNFPSPNKNRRCLEISCFRTQHVPIIVHRFGVKPTIVSNKTTSPCWFFYHEVASFVVGKTSMFVNSIFISMLNLRLYLLKPKNNIILCHPFGCQ